MLRQLGSGERGTRTRGWLDLSPAFEGPARLPAVLVRGTRSGPKVAVLAAQHGDEGYGVLATIKLAADLDVDDVSGDVLLLPCVNRAAYVDGHHHSPFDHQDMNRIHPGSPTGTMTEQVSAALFDRVFSQMDFVVDVHGGSTELGNIPYARFTDVVGKPSARAVAEGLGIRYLSSPTDRKIKGMLSLALMEIGVPSISIETGSAMTHPSDAAEEMAGHVRNSLRLIGALSGATPPRAPVAYTRLVGVRSSVSGAYEPLCRLGDVVTAGALLGRVYDFHGQVTQQAVAAEDGVVGVLKTSVRVHPGESLVWLYAEAPAA